MLQFNVSGSGHLPQSSRPTGQTYASTIPSAGPFMAGGLNLPGHAGGPSMSRGRSPPRQPTDPYMSGGRSPPRHPAGPYMSGGRSPPRQPAGSYMSGGRYQPGYHGGPGMSAGHTPYGSTASLASESSSSVPQYSISEASSGKGSPAPAQAQRLIGWSQSPATGSPRQQKAPIPSSNSSTHQRQGAQDSQKKPQSQALVPYSQRTAGPASRSRSGTGSSHTSSSASTVRGPAVRVPTTEPSRVPTVESPLGDMTRSYLEGMVPNSQADSFRRRHRRNKIRGGD